MFEVEYLENVWRYGLVYNGAPLGNRTCPMASRDLTAGVLGYWGLAEVAPFKRLFLLNNNFCNTKTVLRYMFVKTLFQKSFIKIKYQSLENSEEQYFILL